MPRIEKRIVEPDVVVLDISGSIRLGRDCQDVEWAVEDLIRGHANKVVLDLSGLEYLDSTGIGILVMCVGKMTAAGGELRLASLQPRIVELMKMTRLDQIWTFYPTVAAAAETFMSSGV
jgi:anti-sigma B factor antagonist